MKRFGYMQGRLPAMLAASLLFLFLGSTGALAAETTNPAFPEETIPVTESTAAPSTEPTKAYLPEETETVQLPAESEPEATAPPDIPEETFLEADPEPTIEAASQAVTALATPGTETAGEADIFWHPVLLEDILPTDILAVTITDGTQIWALSSKNGSFSAPAATAVQVENGMLRTPRDSYAWTLKNQDGTLTLSPKDSDLFLYTDNGKNALRVGSLGSPDWKFSSQTLYHPYTKRYLYVDTGKGWWAANRSPEDGQSLAFWRQPRAASVAAMPQGGTLPRDAAVTLSCSDPNATVWYALSADGIQYTPFEPYIQPINMEREADALYIRAYTTAPDSPASAELVFCYTSPPSREPKPDWNLPVNFYFGQLHSHTSLSDGIGSVEEAFSYAAEVDGLDFFAITEHSDGIVNSSQGSITQDGTAISPEWARGKAAAKAVTSKSFVGIFGYEMSWPEGKGFGHIGTFATPGWQTWKQPGFSTLTDYYSALVKVPDAIGQFNHPGDFYGNFSDFSQYKAAYDARMCLMEVGGEGGFRAYDAYTQALDARWHVAPTNNLSPRRPGWTGSARTVLLASELTENALYDAMRHHRAYATDDSDLEIYFTLNGSPMGSILPVQESCSITAYLHDPTDDAVGLVEVIGSGGKVLASKEVDTPWAEVNFPVPGGSAYYYLRLTQADGDIAVTAPVWVDTFQDLGVEDFSTGSAPPVQGQPVEFTVSLYNEETAPFLVDEIGLYAGESLVASLSGPGTVAPAETRSWTLSYTHHGLGAAEFRLVVTGSIQGLSRRFEKTLTLRYHAPQQTGDILVDGSHGNLGLDSLNRFAAIAGEADMRVTVFTEGVPESGKLLLIPQPTQALEEAFTQSLRQFLQKGGSLVVFPGGEDPEILNQLLADIGSEMRFGKAATFWNKPALYNKSISWSAGLLKKSFFHHQQGYAINPGSGQWLVKSPKTGSVLLAWEKTSYGGSIFAGGSLFLSDEALPEPEDPWELPSANQLFLEALLGVHREKLERSAILDAREGENGEVFLVRGYATTGTSNPYNTFLDTLCLQDDTGGIPIVDFTDKGIPVGTPLEVTGYRKEIDGNIVLALIDYTVLNSSSYRYTPETQPCKTVMNYANYGGELVQVEGTVIDLTPTEDGFGLSRLVLRDKQGGEAEVVIGSGIFSGSRGTNTLAEEIQLGRKVRAMGIVYKLDGKTVLFPRNCEEVVYVPPLPFRDNPWTGDILPLWLMVMIGSGGILLTLLIKRRAQTFPRGEGF